MTNSRARLWSRITHLAKGINFLAAFCTFFASLDVSRAQGAEIELISGRSGDPESSARIGLTGIIEQGDYPKFKGIIEQFANSGTFVTSINLSSPGGKVDEALRIGRLIRAKRIATLAADSDNRESICASACALVWLGGVYRVGTVYVHRSYIEDGQSLKFDTWEQALGTSQGSIRQYLDELRVPNVVFQKILETPSTTITPISSGVDVSSMDSVLDEYLLFHCGNRLSENQRIFLDAFEGSDGSGLNVPDKMLLDVLREKDEWVRGCGKRYLISAQKEAQLG